VYKCVLSSDRVPTALRGAPPPARFNSAYTTSHIVLTVGAASSRSQTLKPQLPASDLVCMAVECSQA
jgi:hypothetical protein